MLVQDYTAACGDLSVSVYAVEVTAGMFGLVPGAQLAAGSLVVAGALLWGIHRIFCV